MIFGVLYILLGIVVFFAVDILSPFYIDIGMGVPSITAFLLQYATWVSAVLSIVGILCLCKAKMVADSAVIHAVVISVLGIVISCAYVIPLFGEVSGGILK